MDAPEGTGKTFTIREIQSVLSNRKHSVIAVATYAVAASLLEDGRTAHPVFKIPIPCHPDSVCNISMESKIANAIHRASSIIWDEILCARAIVLKQSIELCAQ